MITLFGKPEPTLLERLKESVGKTKEALADTLDTITQGGRQIDPTVLREVETALLSADIGVKTTNEILDSVREQLSRNALSDGAQSLEPGTFSQLMAELRIIAPAIGRRIA